MQPSWIRLSSARSLLIAAAAVLALLTVVIGQLTSGRGLDPYTFGLSLGIAVPFTVLGLLVLMSLPRHPVGRLMVGAGVFAALYVVAASWPQLVWMSWLEQWSWLPSLGLVFLALLLFPDGRLPSRRWRPVAAVLVAGTVVATAGLAVAAVDQPLLLTALDTSLSPWAENVLVVAGIGALLVLGAAVGVLVSLGLRWRRARGDVRRQLTCLLPAGLVFFIALLLDTYGIAGTWAIAAGAVPLGMAVAILRYRLYDVDLVVNRTIVWLLMTALVIVGFVALVTIFREVLFRFNETQAALLATGLVVVTFEPLHRRVQRGVDRLLYGERDDPYAVLARLGEVLACTVEPNAVMPLVTGTVARSLQVPYVAVELLERDGPVLVAEHGRPGTMTESFDMLSHGTRIGRLLVGRRSVHDRFSRHENRLLRDIAQQAAVAAEATRLNRELQTSRERLVLTREEERRRLRRDLHDGVGPSLAGMSMQLRAARRMLPDDSRPAAILDALAADLTSCTKEVRQLVDELRPPALDQGLDAALRGECRRFDAAGLTVHCEVQGDLVGLPAAVEVAAFRIVAEALTNVARHSRATSCRVTVIRNGVLQVEVVDDGVGLGAVPRIGVGLHSMRERAAELGGDCVVGPAPGRRGTSVRLTLPLGPAGSTPAGSTPAGTSPGVPAEPPAPAPDPAGTVPAPSTSRKG